MSGMDPESLEAIEVALDGAGDVAGAFARRMDELRAAVDTTGREVDVLSRSMSRGLRKAFDGVVFDGMKLSDALKSIATTMVDAAYSAAIKPVTNHFGDLISGAVGGLMGGILPFEKGGSFTQGRVVPFANGGIVSGPTTFPMRGGLGLMGEAGPEAIMPLSRGADGQLGVRMQGGGRPIQVVMNITTPDVEGFRRSQGQIAAQMGRALGRGQRNR